MLIIKVNEIKYYKSSSKIKKKKKRKRLVTSDQINEISFLLYQMSIEENIN